MKIYKLFSYICLFFFLVNTPINATLIDRGNGLIYDDDINITWVQDGTLFGKGPWQAANIWANSLVYGGFDDWRLPSMPQMDPTCVSVETIDYLKYKNCTAGEMGHVYYIELGNEHATNFIESRRNNYGLFPFMKSQGDGHWTSTKFDPSLEWLTDTEARIPGSDNFHWLFYPGRGLKFVLGNGNNRHAMAVRDGDVVPADSSGTLNNDLSFHAPSLDFQTEEGVINIWANLSRYGTGPNNELLWGLDAWGVNETAFTGSMTGEVSDDLSLKINSVHFQNSTFWATFEYFGIDNETHLWVLKDSGENP